MLIKLDQKLSDFKYKNTIIEQFEQVIGPDFESLTKGIDMLGVFSLAKQKNKIQSWKENSLLQKRKYDAINDSDESSLTDHPVKKPS